MIILDTNTSIVCVLDNPKTTNDCDFICTYGDLTSSTLTVSSTSGATNGTSEVTLISAPSSGSRQVKTILITNNDTVSTTVNIKTKNGATYRVIKKHTISANQTLVYNNDTFQVS